MRESMTSVLYCQEAKELLDAFGQTVQLLIKLHEEQFHSVVGGDLDSTRFDDLIHMANEKKYAAKYAYLTHVEDHGCSTFHETDKS